MGHTRQCPKCDGTGGFSVASRHCDQAKVVSCSDCGGTGDEQCPADDIDACPSCAERGRLEDAVVEAIEALEEALDNANQHVEHLPSLRAGLHALRVRLSQPWKPARRAA